MQGKPACDDWLSDSEVNGCFPPLSIVVQPTHHYVTIVQLPHQLCSYGYIIVSHHTTRLSCALPYYHIVDLSILGHTIAHYFPLQCPPNSHGPHLCLHHHKILDHNGLQYVSPTKPPDNLKAEDLERLGDILSHGTFVPSPEKFCQKHCILSKDILSSFHF